MKARTLTGYSAHLLAVLGLTLANSCSVMPDRVGRIEQASICTTGASLFNPEAAPGIGGTGQIALRPGIGGTGHAENPTDKNGVGIGLIGIITGFASICVNGIEVHYTPSTPVTQDGERSRTRDLAVGQVVAVRAVGALDKAEAQAQQIAVLHAAIGPLTRADQESGQFEVMGQRVQALVTNDLRRMREGDWVRVSGHRLADGTIRASLVQGVAVPFAQAQVLGPVTAIHGSTVHVGTTVVRFDTLPQGLALGREIAVQGRWIANELFASKNALRTTLAELGPVKTVVMQGYVHAKRDNELSLGHESMTFAEQVSVHGGTLKSLAVNDEVQIHGHIDAQQRIVVEQIRIGGGSHGRGQSGISPHAHAGFTSGNAHGSNSGGSGNAGASAGGSGGSGGSAGGR